MRHILCIFIIILVLIGVTFVQTSEKKQHSEQKIDCQLCHSCDNPTKKDPCLKECPRLQLIKVHGSPEEGPEVVIIDELSDISDLYVPVVFSHKLHAEMSELSGGCSICHHRNPPEAKRILTCKECHEPTPIKADLSKMGLKGAYHRQCLGCHREWSHTTECAVCHALKSTEDTKVASVDSSDIMGTKHPPIPEPGKIIYETDYKKGKLVTFYHDEHTKLFGIKCADCHQKESCNKCHDLSKPTLAEQIASSGPIKVDKSVEEQHQPCFSCHQNEKCSKCHGNKSKKRFDHALSANWPLKHYHKKIACTRCHGEKTEFTKLNKKCSKCHKVWNSENFNHKVTGLILDENHIENDCEDCHAGRNYMKKPTCDNCHDDISYPKSKPGSFRKK